MIVSWGDGLGDLDFLGIFYDFSVLNFPDTYWRFFPLGKSSCNLDNLESPHF